MNRYQVFIFALTFLFVGCQEDVFVPPLPPTTPPPPTPPTTGIDPMYQACLSELSNSTFDIMTWNMEFYPKIGNTTEEAVYGIVRNAQIDLIAVQEIDSETALRDLARKLGNWEVKMGNVSSSQDVGFLYNKDEITLLEGPTTIYGNNSYAFPREPVIIKVKHVNGLEAVVINLHLKCCNGSEDRRKEASSLLESYIASTHPNTAVIILGDWNDEIYEGGNQDVFGNFMTDAANYQFADKEIATGPSTNWSYPSYPSHIDHLLITNELFDNLGEVRTLALNNCINTYYSTISDHRPVMMRLNAD